MKRSTYILLLCWFCSFSTAFSQGRMQKQSISLNELRDKIAGAWIGQLIGNMYGLPHENKYIAEPGPENWPYGYTKSLNKLITYNGAFSDDDTDIEYMYLCTMEKTGPEPSYEDLKNAWMYHVRDRVWLANRAALGLMHYGYTPPFTGSKEYNPHWYQIDPQLINEIWGYTAPGMIKYAAQKSDWAARITSDDWATEPTVLYGAMYAAAFFEKDIHTLITIGLRELPPEGRYANTVKTMLNLFEKYPDDWKKARQQMAEEYYVNEPAETKSIWNANLNGACGILALLYGKGDFQKTLDLACAMGFDADNQAATLGGLLGVIHGFKKLPPDLYRPLKEWKEPFNDRYVNITRYDLPDAKISNIIDRIVDQTLLLVQKKGGKITVANGNKMIVINREAEFNPPVEFCIGPSPLIEVGKPVDYNFYTLTNQHYRWILLKGNLPEGLTFLNGKLMGTPSRPGRFFITLQLDNGKEKAVKEFELWVRNKNIAPIADTVFANVRVINQAVLDSTWCTCGKQAYTAHIDAIRDGVLYGKGSTFISLAAKTKIPKVDYYGYGWKDEHTIDLISLHAGCLEEFGGWFTSLNVQYQNAEGKWVPVEELQIIPPLPENTDVFHQAPNVEYLLAFRPVRTRAVRIIGDAAIQNHWHKYTNTVSSFTSITELSVYESSQKP